MLLARALLTFFGLSFVAFGVWALVDPGSMTPLIHFTLENAVARTEFRAFYGGLEIGLGLYLLACMRGPVPALGGLSVFASVSVAIGIARLIGIAVDGSSGGFIYGALVWEFAGAGLAIWAYRMVRATADQAASR